MNIPTFPEQLCDAMSALRKLTDDECSQNRMMYHLISDFLFFNQNVEEKSAISLVNWDNAPLWAKFHAVDSDGRGFFYSCLPFRSYGRWMVDYDDGEKAEQSSGYFPQTKTWWERTIERRP